MEFLKNDKHINAYIQVGIDSNTAIVPTENMVATVNTYEQYIKEKDNANKYRLLFNVNTLCSNVLHNVITEIVRNEGGVNTELITESGFNVKTPYNAYTKRSNNSNNEVSLKKTLMIQDTAYSSKDIFSDKIPYVYHCGIDIFNNHTLRAKENSIINRLNSNSSDSVRKNFNTIKDYNRDYFGNLIQFNKVPKTGNVGITTSNEHRYTNDNIYTFDESITYNLIENNGWVGFKNRSTLHIPNYVTGSTQVVINKTMNNNKNGEFIDLYPDRTLYSMVPKFNSQRQRIEYNWNYCLTYPYKNITDNDLIKGGIKTEYVATDNTGTYITFRTMIRNGFKPNMKIFVYFGKNVVETTVNSIGINGKDEDYYFTVSYSSIMGIFNSKSEIRVGRIVEGIKCQYYIRQFKKLPNFNRLGINPKYGVTDAEINKGMNNPFSTTLNKLAFAKNAYGDNVAQIIYDDDIMIEGLVDNLNRPLTEIYLTIIKNNKGNEKWYEQGRIGDEDVEFSHCFGKISSGFDLPTFSHKYNVHKIHNIKNLTDKASQPKNVLSYINESVSPLETNITKDKTTFYGDIVEYSPLKMEERVLEDVYYRFNTKQREICNNPNYQSFNIDEIIYDDYDFQRDGSNSDFKAITVQYGANINENTKEGAEGFKNVNVNPEGYYYKPHYKIQLREFEDEVQIGSHQLIGSYKLAEDYIEVFNENSEVVSDQEYESSNTNDSTETTYRVSTNVANEYTYVTISNKVSSTVTEKATLEYIPQLHTKTGPVNQVSKLRQDIVNDSNALKKPSISTFSLQNTVTTSNNGSLNKLTISRKDEIKIPGPSTTQNNGKTGISKIVGNDFIVSTNNKMLFHDKASNNSEVVEATYIKPIVSNNSNESVFPSNNESELESKANISGITITLDKEYYIVPNDTIYIMDIDAKKIYDCGYVTKKVGNKVTISFGKNIDFKSNTIYFLKPNPLKPKYAFDMFDQYGTYIWKNIKSFGKIGNDNELYNVTYTNGALYYEKPINLYLRRQDPFDEYSLIKTNEMPSRMRALLNAGERKDVELLEYQSENYTSC